MSKQPAVKPKTTTAKPATKPTNNNNNQTESEEKVEDTTDDEAYARQLQQEMYNEQEEIDAAMARRLHDEEQSQGQMPFQFASRRRPDRPATGTPLHALFRTIYGMRAQNLDLEDDDDNDDVTPAMDPDSDIDTTMIPAHRERPNLAGLAERANFPVSNERSDYPALPSERPDPSIVDLLNPSDDSRRPDVADAGDNGAEGRRAYRPRGGIGASRSPQRAYRAGLMRSPERPVRGGRGRSLAMGRQGASGSTASSSEPSIGAMAPAIDPLPGVQLNPFRARGQGRGRRRIVVNGLLRPGESSSEPEIDMPSVRPIAAMDRPLPLGLGPREETFTNLPAGEYDPDFMVMDLGENEDTREDNFLNIVRDPFLLMLLLMGRQPGLMVPDDVDLNDYEALWDLAERLGEVQGRGMKEEEIHKLPKRTYRHGKGENCSICLSEFSMGNELLLLPCKHEYHQDCLLEWLKRNASCPICRQDVKKKKD